MTTGPTLGWGEPRPAEWSGPRDALHCRLPVELLHGLREQARTEGVTLSILVHRLLVRALRDEHERVLESALRDHLG